MGNFCFLPIIKLDKRCLSKYFSPSCQARAPSGVQLIKLANGFLDQVFLFAWFFNYVSGLFGFFCFVLKQTYSALDLIP